MNLATLLVGSLASFAAGDVPAHFGATCTASLAGYRRMSTFCGSEDLRSDGFNNRFHFLLAPIPVTALPRIADYVRVESTIDGHLRVSSVLLGELDLSPRSESVRLWMRSHAPAWEVRPQNVTVNVLADGAVEILIDEPCEDFNGRSPSPDWLLRNASAHALLGNAR